MKHILFLCLSLFVFCGCEESEDDFLVNPDVETFVKQIKDGTYNIVGTDGFVEIPDFQREHIPELLEYAEDLTAIQPYFLHVFSSATGPTRLGEAMLWTIEGIRQGTKYPSYSGHLYNMEDELYSDIPDEDVLKVAAKYKKWWKEEYPFNKVHDKFSVFPLEETSFRWN